VISTTYEELPGEDSVSIPFTVARRREVKFRRRLQGRAFGLLIRYVLEESGINTETPAKGQEHFRAKLASTRGFLVKIPFRLRHDLWNGPS